MELSAFVGSKVFELNAHALRSEGTKYPRVQTQGRPAGLKFQTDGNTGVGSKNALGLNQHTTKAEVHRHPVETILG